MPLNIVFMGTPEFAVPALAGLLRSPHNMRAVYTQPPRPAHRGQKLTPSPVHRLAEATGATVETPVNFKDPASIDHLKSYGADIAVVAAYGLLLPKAVLEAFPKGCINIHPSALPRWRGAAPIHRTVMAGDTATDICIMQMDEGLDTGPVLLRSPLQIPQGITTGALHDMLSEASVPLLLETLDAIEAGTVHAIPQPSEGVTYAKKITKEEAVIDWHQPAAVIDAHIRGLNPYPVAQTLLAGEVLKVWDAVIESSKPNAAPGTVIDEGLGIACQDAVIRLQAVQRPGKKPMPTAELLRGYPVPSGTMLG